MAPRKLKVTQESFDAAVQENIDEFEMEAEEAVTAAVEEFEAQGVDLTGIIRSGVASVTADHPVALAKQALVDASQSHNPHDTTAALQALTLTVASDNPTTAAEGQTVAVRVEAVAAVLAIIQQQAMDAAPAENDGNGVISLDVTLIAMQALHAMLLSDGTRCAFEAARGAAKLQQLLHTALKPRGDRTTAQLALVEATAHVAARAAFHHEDNKCQIVDSALAAALIGGLSPPVVLPESDASPAAPAVLTAGVVASVCAMIIVLCVSDDERQLDVLDGCVPGGRAFQNARTLAAASKKSANGGTNGSGVAMLLPLIYRCADAAKGPTPAGEGTSANSVDAATFKEANGSNTPQTAKGTPQAVSSSSTSQAMNGSGTSHAAAAASWTLSLPEANSAAVPVCQALKALCVNDDICREVDEGGGLSAAVALLHLRSSEPQIVAAALELLSMLAHRDACKDALASAGLLGTICRLAVSYATNPVVMARAIGLLVAMTLRHPDNSVAAFEAGCTDAVLKAMKDEDMRDAAAGSPEMRGFVAAVQRAGCMAIRNICARCPDLRPLIAASGAEQVLRAAKKGWPSTCGDVGAAALRDMGCENYIG